MKNKKFYLIKSIPMILVMVLAACTFHWPYDYYEDRGHFRVVFNVQPDDAEVLLNGRLIGLAYEFSSRDSALILASKDNELVLRKRGYAEEEVNLLDYPGREVLIQFKMRPRGDYGTKPKVEEEKPSYEAKIETVQTPPVEKDAGKAPAAVTIVALTVSPAEAAIYINGKFWGIAPEEGKISNLRLAPGKYLIDVTKPDFKAFSKEVEVPKQEKFELQVKLEK